MSLHTYESLSKLRGQAVKDIWHAKIGKPAGIKNTTGLKSIEEIIHAILKAETDESFVQSFQVRPLKQGFQEPVELEEMPPKPKPVEKKKPGPKPKPKPVAVQPQGVTAPVPLQAYETTEIPLKVDEVVRVIVRKLIVGDMEYFLETKTNKVFGSVNGRPGNECGTWNVESREVVEH
jgi:hypothetical protein